MPEALLAYNSKHCFIGYAHHPLALILRFPNVASVERWSDGKLIARWERTP